MLVSVLLIVDKLDVRLSEGTSRRSCRNGSACGTARSRSSPGETIRIVMLLDFVEDQVLDVFMLQVAWKLSSLGERLDKYLDLVLDVVLNKSARIRCRAEFLGATGIVRDFGIVGKVDKNICVVQDESSSLCFGDRDIVLITVIVRHLALSSRSCDGDERGWFVCAKCHIIPFLLPGKIKAPYRQAIYMGGEQRENRERSNESADQLNQVIHMLPDKRAVHSPACKTGAQGAHLFSVRLDVDLSIRGNSRLST